MSRWLIPLVLGTVLLVPLAASAKKKAKPLVLEPLAADIRAKTGELTTDQTKALRQAGRCLEGDRFWAREMENRDPVNQTYETLAGAVVCWQGAEKKAGKQDEGFASAKRFIQARTRYVETLRSFYFALTEKLRTGADQGRLCERLSIALGEAGKANELGAGLAEVFQNEEARALAAQLDADIKYWGEGVASEYKHQKCVD